MTPAELKIFSFRSHKIQQYSTEYFQTKFEMQYKFNTFNPYFKENIFIC